MRKTYQNVDLIRKCRGVSITSLAKKAHISRNTCTKQLSGVSKMPAEILRCYATALNISDIGTFYDDALTNAVITASVSDDKAVAR